MHRRIAVPLITALATSALAAPALASDTSAAALTWEPCPSESAPTKECAWLTVPRRYDKPNGPTVKVALARIPATGSADDKVGSLLWDAGGPGGPSTAIVDSFVGRLSPAVRERFDFVAFDPRGIGASIPALEDCGDPWPVRPALNPLPNWRSVQKKSAAVLADDNRVCLRDNRRIAEVMGTNNVVKDLERIRAALGDRKLTFWGTSYGTRIGYVYALAYPQRVRAMVMDGSIDPSNGFRTLPRIGGLSQDSALAFIKKQDRPIYRTVVQTTASLTADPIALPDGTTFSRWNWIDIVGDLVAFQDAWPNLPQYAQVVDTARLPGEQGDAARAFLERAKARPNSNEGGGFSVVNCLDYAQRLTAKQQADLAADNAKRGPIAGGSLTLMYAMGCSGLDKLTPDPVPLVTTAKQRAKLAKVPVLLANATNDGSTPMAWAKRMQKAFDRPMIRYRSTQHVIWGATTSKCVNAPIDKFVLTLKMPAKSRTCDYVPSVAPTP
jgi:pimeloyl-ACP methyl ester carboxylesterase